MRAPAARFVLLGSESQLPFLDESFDVCFSTEVIEHLFDIRGLVGEIHRALRPGGSFPLTTPYHGWLKNLIIISRGFEKHFDVEGGTFGSSPNIR